VYDIFEDIGLFQDHAIAVAVAATTPSKLPWRDGGVSLWAHVIPHFTKFLQALELEAGERADAEGKAERIARCLWSYYYFDYGEFKPYCYVKVGSYGKGTATRPPSDLDMLFLLPAREFTRIGQLAGNQPSQLLQEVKETLEDTFPRTDLRADGQVVVAPFQTYNVEIIPAFLMKDGTYITAHTANGGSWRASNPAVEYQWISAADSISGGKAMHLIKMLKAWKRECSVDIKSISLEVLACIFVSTWPYRNQTLFFYDWLVRDFFEFMLPYRWGWTIVPGTQEKIYLGNSWGTKCESAYQRAFKAEQYERADDGDAAAEEWRKVFGNQFAPAMVPVAPSLMFLKALAAARR
jgi:hypothetical protein